MSVELLNVRRTRQVTGVIYLERWIQIDAGTDQIDADLNALDALCDSSTTSSCWYGAPSPGEVDPGDQNAAWYGQVIRIPFKRIQASGEWEKLKDAVRAFVETAFPGEIIHEANRRFNRPEISDVAQPSKYILWMVAAD